MDSLLDLDGERGLAGRQRVARGGSGVGRALQVCSCAPLKETPWAMTRRSCHRDCCPGAGANERQLRLRLHILLSPSHGTRKPRRSVGTTLFTTHHRKEAARDGCCCAHQPHQSHRLLPRSEFSAVHGQHLLPILPLGQSVRLWSPPHQATLPPPIGHGDLCQTPPGGRPSLLGSKLSRLNCQQV